MKSVKIKLSLIIALALATVISLCAFLFTTLAKAERKVSPSGSSIFTTAAGAKIWASDEKEEDNAHYTMFALVNNGDSVNYRKDLAYNWIANTESIPEGENPEIAFNGDERWFNMTIGFDKPNETLGFEKFVITFESQQYYQTKDGKTTNYLIFTPVEGNSDLVEVYVAHKTPDDEDMDKAINNETVKSLGQVSYGNIKIEFTDSANGNYDLKITSGSTELTGTGDKAFTNIGKTYAKRSTSTTNPVTPMSFKAIFPTEEVDGEEVEVSGHGNALMVLYELNGQSFKLDGASKQTDDGGEHWAGGTINDETPPVLCLDKGVPFINYNGEITFDYTVIDVVTSSPSLTTSYFMLTDTQAKDGNFTPVYKEDGGIYRKVTDSDDQYMIPHVAHYLPVKDTDYNSSVYDENFEVKGAVKIVLKLTDTTSDGGQSTYVLLDWYVPENNLIKLNGDENKKYIAVATDNLGVTFGYTQNGQSNPDDNTWKEKVADYQAEVTEAAQDLQAGSKNYFYLPSVENLLADNATAYSDLTFSIYYKANGSNQQATSKKANELSINLNRVGKYRFTIYANDAQNNKMYYFKLNGEEWEKVEFETGDIWNMYDEKDGTDFEDTRKYLPWFEFNVDSAEFSIEDPDEQSTAYVGSSYTPDSFDINTVNYSTSYELYQFENSLYAEANNGVAMLYEDFIKNKATVLDDYSRYFTRIRTTSSLKEGTADYEKFNDYGWNGSSLTFTPQSDNAFYLIVCTVTSKDTQETKTAYMGIAAAPKVEPLQGEDTWVEDNLTSIILLSIAGASLVGIVLLLVIKPKNKGDVDEAVFEARSRKKK
ncbi:MAG: hypothetical protein HDQ88_06730 [Clostridia bacterium]|nr:hypothetical protein [Clostridia bacterium]